MKIGLIVDGVAEYRSLREILPRIKTQHQFVKLLHADIQPYATIPQIVREIKKKLVILSGKKADLALILIDLEEQDICPAEWSSRIEHYCAEKCVNCGVRDFRVVIKVRCYENWLVADPDALTLWPKHFNVPDSYRRKIAPNKADSVAAQELIKSLVIRSAYDKVEDAVRIMQKAEPSNIAQNSRSFRRFLRVVGDEDYADQSAKPAKPKK